ncbi:MAG: VWA domain-containing protein [Candidatus Diapherotrites archaeon]
MVLKILKTLFLLVLFSQIVFSLEISGDCSFEAVQCDLRGEQLKVCNNSQSTQTYFSVAKNYEAVNWFNVLPETFTLEPNECTTLNVFSVAHCYADPGKYFADILVYNQTEKMSKVCSLDLKQGHFLGISSSSVDFSLAQCEEKTIEITLENNSIVPNQTIERVQILLFGLEKSWYTLSSEKVNVVKGSPQKIVLKIHPPCDAKKGDYPFRLRGVLVNPNFYTEKNFNLNISSGQDLRLVLGDNFVDGKYNTCFEKIENPLIKIHNLGKLEDEINLSLNAPDWIKLSKNNISLKSNSIAEIDLILDKTKVKKGNFPVSITAKSSFGNSVSKDFVISINDCYSIQFSKVSGPEVVCSEENPTFEFEVKNSSLSELNLNVSLSGLPGELNKKSFAISSNGLEKFNATIDVSKLVKEENAKLESIALEIVFDVSGSMNELTNGEKKIFSAKKALSKILDKIEDVSTAFRVFGQGEKCEDSYLFVKPNKGNYETIKRYVQSLEPNGMTPLAQALKASSFDFVNLSNSKKYILLISDGKETCDGNIQEAIKVLKDLNIVVFSIGFDIDEDGKRQLQLISSSTNGKYFDAHNLEELEDSLYNIYFSIGVIKQQDAKKKFSISLKSDSLSYERDFSLEIVKCYSADLFLAPVNFCPGHVSKNKAILYNYGELPQKFFIDYYPKYIVNGLKEVEVKPKSVAEIDFNVIANSDINTIKVIAASDKMTIEKEQKANLLSDVVCFDFSIIATEKDIDAKTCEGRVLKLYLENKGLEPINVFLSSDKNYVHFPEKEISLEASSAKTVIYFISPPFDLPEKTEITIYARNSQGLERSTKINLLLSETQESFLRNGEKKVNEMDLNLPKLDLNNVALDLNNLAKSALIVLPENSTLILAFLILLMMVVIAFSTIKSIYKK